MTEIFISNRAYSIRHLLGDDPDAIVGFCDANSLPRTALLPPATPYLLSAPASESRVVLQRLNNMPLDDRRRLAHMADTFGEPTPLLAAFHERALEPLRPVNNVASASATAITARAESFQKALEQYQHTLLELNDFERRGRGSSVQRAQLQSRVRVSHEVLNQHYRAELRRLVPQVNLGKNRGYALTSAERGLTLARRRRVQGLYVSNAYGASWLAKFAQAGRFVGRGAVGLDLGLHAAAVRSTQHQGGDWLREASMQTTGFGLGGAAGLLAGQSTVAAMTSIGLIAGPIGWVAVIGIGTVAGLGIAHGAD